MGGVSATAGGTAVVGAGVGGAGVGGTGVGGAVSGGFVGVGAVEAGAVGDGALTEVDPRTVVVVRPPFTVVVVPRPVAFPVPDVVGIGSVLLTRGPSWSRNCLDSSESEYRLVPFCGHAGFRTTCCTATLVGVGGAVVLADAPFALGELVVDDAR